MNHSITKRSRISYRVSWSMLHTRTHTNTHKHSRAENYSNFNWSWLIVEFCRKTIECIWANVILHKYNAKKRLWMNCELRITNLRRVIPSQHAQNWLICSRNRLKTKLHRFFFHFTLNSVEFSHTYNTNEEYLQSHNIWH